MAHNWQLQDAKNKFSKVVEDALKEGPQVITRHGVETVVVLSLADYRKILLRRKGLVEFFQESPLAGVELDLTRDAGPARNTDITL
jgi:antitoxin Phd